MLQPISLRSDKITQSGERSISKYLIGVILVELPPIHYSDIIMSSVASQITVVWNIYSTVCSGADERRHQSSASLAFVRGIHRGPVNSLHKGSVTRKMYPYDDVIMWLEFKQHAT